MHCDSAVPAEWQQNMSIPFFCGPTSRLETWATLLCRLCCLHEDKFFGILSVHFSQWPSLVKATHPHDQHDWAATPMPSISIRTHERGQFGMQQLQVNHFGNALDTLAPSV